jgi:hypothetical protein
MKEGDNDYQIVLWSFNGIMIYFRFGFFFLSIVIWLLTNIGELIE